LSAEQAERARLKKQLREAEIERDILKKAVSIFFRKDGKFFMKKHHSIFSLRRCVRCLKLVRVDIIIGSIVSHLPGR
jgi:hypothetical protein